MGLIVVKTKQEEKEFLKLVKEFASRIVLPRGFKSTKTFDEFKKIGVCGIIDHTKDEETSEIIYDVALPDCFVEFIRYELDHLKVPAISSPAKRDQSSLRHTD